MVLRVADICEQVSGKENLYIATDSKKIKSVVIKAGYKSIMTSRGCLTGTDRVAEHQRKLIQKYLLMFKEMNLQLILEILLKFIRLKLNIQIMWFVGTIEFTSLRTLQVKIYQKLW